MVFFPPCQMFNQGDLLVLLHTPWFNWIVSAKQCIFHLIRFTHKLRRAAQPRNLIPPWFVQLNRKIIIEWLWSIESNFPCNWSNCQDLNKKQYSSYESDNATKAPCIIQNRHTSLLSCRLKTFTQAQFNHPLLQKLLTLFNYECFPC